ncbi:MAG: hypothetical protein Kow0059_15370 [Candidatus Sumerlaeia bacterium]
MTSRPTLSRKYLRRSVIPGRSDHFRICRRFLPAAALMLILATMAIPRTWAHGSYGLFVPRLGPTDPIPTIDGQISNLEYQTAWRFSRLIYRPRLNHPPVFMRLTSSSTDLFVALENLPFGTGAQTRFISLVFDVDHNGGAFPDAGDIRFTVTENNTREASRGNGTGGFTADPTITDWTSAAVPNPNNEFAWNCEIRIPLTRLGGGDRFEVIGFHLRHNWLAFQGDDYAWPPAAGWNVPNTWGELIWLAPPENRLMVDVARISQGLEVDVTAREPYAFIAGKKTHVWAQLYATSGSTIVNSAEVLVQRVSPTLGPVRSTTASTTPRLLPFTPAGYISRGREFQFWIPGEHFDQPGVYRFQLAVRRSGDGEPQILALGSREYKPSKDFTVLLLPINLTGVVPDGRDWGDDLTANVTRAMQELERHLPVRDGALPFSPSSNTPVNAGVRFFLWPGVVQPRSGENLDSLDRRARALGNNLLHLSNLFLELRDPFNSLGRIDRMCGLGASTGTGGGQAQNGWSPCTAGAGFDRFPTGASASVVIQELVHCLGWQVKNDSPNFDGGGHSINSVIPTIGGRDVVNMLDRTLVSRAASAMYPLVGWVPNQFIEGHEWNTTHQELLHKPRLPVCRGCRGESPATAPAESAIFSARVFRFIGSISDSDVVTETYTEVRDGEGLDLTPADPASPYELLLLDGQGGVLESLKFHVDFEATGPHQVLAAATGASPRQTPGAYSQLADHSSIAELGLVIQMPFAEASTGAQLRKGSDVLWSKSFSTAAPTVGNVQALDNQQGLIELSWTAADTDTPLKDLRYCVFFETDVQGDPILIAHGLDSQTFSFPTVLAPAAPQARLIVCATDGKNTGEGQSNAFPIPPRPPVVQINRPDPADPTQPQIVAGVPLVMQASVFDLTDGALDGAAVVWDSDKDGTLGTGTLLPAAVLSTPGQHTITVRATNSANLTAGDSVLITALADTDGDGMPDDYEAQWPCLNPQIADSGEDQDGDGLAALEERRLGTNPCEPDSDGDEFADGDEGRLGSDPGNGGSKPLPDLLFIPGGPVNLGACPQPSQAAVPVKTSSPALAWTAAPLSPWLTLQNSSGQGDGEILVSADCSALPAGPQEGAVLITAAGGPPRLIEVEIIVPLCLGDVTGDAAVDALDLSAVVDHILGRAALAGAALEAADVTGDLRIDVGDVIGLQNHLDGSNPLPGCQ